MLATEFANDYASVGSQEEDFAELLQALVDTVEDENAVK